MVLNLVQIYNISVLLQYAYMYNLSQKLELIIVLLTLRGVPPLLGFLLK